MNLLKQRIIKNLPTNLQHDIHKIAIGNKPYLIGSGSIVSLTYNSDFDVNEIVNVKDLESHINQLKKENDIWITSINKKKDYVQINTICNINGVLLDVNDTIFNKSDSKIREKEKSKSLKKDIDDYIADGNYFKAVKRLYTLLSINPKKNIKLIRFITEFLNSNIGLLSGIINQLEIIKRFYCVSRNRMDLVYNNLELCKLNLNKIYCVKIEDRLFKMFSIESINKLIQLLNNKLQKYTRQFLHLNRTVLKI